MSIHQRRWAANQLHSHRLVLRLMAHGQIAPELLVVADVALRLAGAPLSTGPLYMAPRMVHADVARVMGGQTAVDVLRYQDELVGHEQ